MSAKSSVAAALLSAIIVAACGDAPGPAATVVPPAPPSGSSTSPSIAPSAAPSLAPIASPTHTAIPTTGSAGWFPWLPPIDQTVDASFERDSFVTAVADVVPVSGEPGGPPYRFDTGEPDPSSHPLIGFMRGGLLVVLHGPVVVEGIEWYLLTPAQLSIDVPTGWSPVASRAGVPWLERSAFDCPTSPLTTGDLAPLMLTDGLPACYGDAEVTIVGELGCDAQLDRWVTGPSWVEGGVCQFGVPPSIYGLQADLPAGRYAVTGHFDDTEARDCRSTDGDDSDTGRLTAILHCRRAFVATSVVPAT